MQSGIYLITCRRPGALPLYYVGQSQGCEKRFAQHHADLRSGRHANKHMQSAFVKYGETSFTMEVLEHVEAADLNHAEQWWLDEMVGYARTLNVGIDATSGMRGRSHTAESKYKLSQKSKQKKLSPEHLKALILGGVNRTRPPEEVERRRMAQQGRIFSDEHRKRMSAAAKDRRASDEHRENISKAMKANHPMAGINRSNHPLSKKVIGTNKLTGEEITFGSTQCAKDAGFSGSCISLACNGKLKSHKGYTWRYAM